jgi:hypothetical protein
VAVLGSITFTANGGTGPYAFSKTSGTGTVTAGGLYTAPSQGGSAVIRVTDASNATSEAAVTIKNLFDPAMNRSTQDFAPALATGDFNGDGAADIAVSAYSAVNVFFGQGDGGFSNPVTPSCGTDCFAIAVGRINSDLKDDLVVTSRGTNEVAVLLATGTNMFMPAATHGAFPNPNGVVLADWGGTGVVSLAVTLYASTSNVLVFNGIGGAAFTNGTTLTASPFPRSITAAHFNADTNMDLAVVSYDPGNTSLVTVFLGLGAGEFGGPSYYSSGAVPYAVTTGDFNHDNTPDLLVVNRDSSSVSVLPGVGNGTFLTALITPTGPTPDAPAVADFNGDGFLDVAVVTLGNVEVLLGKGDGLFQAPLGYGADATPTGVVAADFNGDGKPDLAVSNFGNPHAQLSILLNSTQ